MAFDHKNFVQFSAGETAVKQTSGCASYFYESHVDDLHPGPTPPPTGMLAPDYFNPVSKILRYGSYLALSYTPGAYGPAWENALYVVITDQPNIETVVLERVSPPAPAPSPVYQVMAEVPLTYVTSGGNTDIVPLAESEVGFFATYSLNSGITDVGPPVAHSGIEFVECQAGQILIDYSRPVVAGQTVLLWVQIRSATPTP